MREAVKVSNDSPVLLDRFLNDAVECDVDALSDGEEVIIGGVMEHIEQAGVHSGDSACSLPPLIGFGCFNNPCKPLPVDTVFGIKGKYLKPILQRHIHHVKSCI